MAQRRYSTEQIIAALEPVEEPVELGLPVADLIRQMGITEQTYYRWSEADRNRFAFRPDCLSGSKSRSCTLP